MNETSELFLLSGPTIWFLASVGGVLFAIFFFGKSRPPVSSLNLRSSTSVSRSGSASLVPFDDEVTDPFVWEPGGGERSQFASPRSSRGGGAGGGPAAGGASGSAPQSRELNVVFVYNGHPFDAFEILGIPAGSSPEVIDRAYLAMKSRISMDQKGLLEAAYSAFSHNARR